MRWSSHGVHVRTGTCDLVSEPGLVGPKPCTSWSRKRLQSAIDGGGAHRQQLAPHQRLQAQRAFRLQRGDEVGEERCQTLAAQPAAGLGAQAQGADYHGRIDASAAAVTGARRRWTHRGGDGWRACGDSPWLHRTRRVNGP